MNKFLTLIFVFSVQFNPLVHSFEPSTQLHQKIIENNYNKFEMIKELFAYGSLPELDTLPRFTSGRCYSRMQPNHAEGSLLTVFTYENFDLIESKKIFSLKPYPYDRLTSSNYYDDLNVNYQKQKVLEQFLNTQNDFLENILPDVTQEDENLLVVVDRFNSISKIKVLEGTIIVEVSLLKDDPERTLTAGDAPIYCYFFKDVSY